MNRVWMPCVDSDESPCLWDFEFAIETGCFNTSVLEKLHAVSSGVLFRQVSPSTFSLY